MSAAPSANAVKHGLSSLYHMPRGRENELQPILAELIESREPQTKLETEIVHELAFNMWKRGECERMLADQDQIRLIDPIKLYEKEAEADFDQLYQKYVQSPGHHLPAMSQSLAGVKHCIRAWTVFQAALADGAAAPSLNQAANAIRTLGSSSSAIWIFGEGELLMKQVLALRPNPDRHINEWLRDEDLESSTDAINRTKMMRENLPFAGEARVALRKKAEEQLKHWKSVLVSVEANEQAAKTKFLARHQYDVELDPAREAHLERLTRYLASANNNVKDCNRRLANLKAEAAKERRRAEDKAERDKKLKFEEEKLKQQKYQARARANAKFNLGTPDPDEGPETFYRVPTDWESRKNMLTFIKPNCENFMYWRREYLADAPKLFNYLDSLEGIDRQWLSELKFWWKEETAYREANPAKTY